jgi:hypothetical protein
VCSLGYALFPTNSAPDVDSELVASLVRLTVLAAVSSHHRLPRRCVTAFTPLTVARACCAVHIAAAC